MYSVEIVFDRDKIVYHFLHLFCLFFSYLFWADAGPQPKIERSDLIGGGRSIITWAGLIKPTSLCIDQSTDKLFWTDTLRGTIEYSDFYGLQRSILISNSQQDYYGIAVFRVCLSLLYILF